MKVIILNGTIGEGKTTVGKYIADQYPGSDMSVERTAELIMQQKMILLRHGMRGYIN